DHVMPAAEAEAVLANIDSFAGRGLAGDRQLALFKADGQVTFEGDQARDGKHNCARSAVGKGLGNGIAETARAAVVQVCYLDDAPPASATSETAIPFRAGEREMPLAEIP